MAGLVSKAPFLPTMSSNALLLIVPFAILSIVLPDSLTMQQKITLTAPLLLLILIFVVQTVLVMQTRFRTQKAVTDALDGRWKKLAAFKHCGRCVPCLTHLRTCPTQAYHTGSEFALR
jgi:hypothetical protein